MWLEVVHWHRLCAESLFPVRPLMSPELVVPGFLEARHTNIRQQRRTRSSPRMESQDGFCPVEKKKYQTRTIFQSTFLMRSGQQQHTRCISTNLEPNQNCWTMCFFPRAWHRLHVFPLLALFACFPALGTGCTFSRPWPRLLVFPRLTPVVLYCFPATGTVYLFSRAWHWLLVFPPLALVACFHALCTSCMLSHAWHRLQTVARSTVLGTGHSCMFSCALHRLYAVSSRSLP